MSKSNRGVRGDGYFVKDAKGHFFFRIPIGVYENGRTRYKSFSGKTKTEAKKKAQEYIQLHGCLEQLGKTPLLKDYILWWLKNYKKDSHAVKPQTYTRMCTVVNNQIIPCLGDYRLIDLSKSVIQTELLNPLLNDINPNTGKPLSVSTVKKAVIHLRDCLNQAVEDDFIRKNPCATVKISKNVVASNKKEMRFFDDEEVEAFCEAASAETANGFPRYKFGQALILLLHTGMRVGELIALTPQDVDLYERTIKVHRGNVEFYDMDPESDTYRQNVQYRSEFTKTENGDRTVPLTADAFDACMKMYTLCKHTTDFLITHSEKPTQYHILLRTYKTVCERAGIENPCGIHTLRHSCASMMLRRDINIKMISELLGHGSVQFTYDTYIHLVKKQKTDAVKYIDSCGRAEKLDIQRNLVKEAVEEGMTVDNIASLLEYIPAKKLGLLLAEMAEKSD